MVKGSIKTKKKKNKKKTLTRRSMMKEGQHCLSLLIIRKGTDRGVKSTERDKAGEVCSSANGPERMRKIVRDRLGDF